MRLTFDFRVAIVIVLGLPLIAAGASETHPFYVHDMLAMDRISDPQVSPDARRVVFVLRRTDLEADRGRTDLWLVDVDGTHLRRFTSHPENDWNPRWSPDGRTIYFLSARSGKSEVWRIAPDGGEATRVSDEPLDIGALVVSPEGTHLGISMDVFPGATPRETADRLKAIEDHPASGRIYDRLFIRHWDTWKDGRRSHVFVYSLDDGEAVDIMKEMDADCPTKPFGGPEDLTFTPDGRSIVFTARDAGREEAWSMNFDLFLAPIDGSAKPRCLTGRNKAWDAHPAFSPDGRTLAYLSMERPGYESDRFRIILRPVNALTGPYLPPPEPIGPWILPDRVLTEEWDRSPMTIAWSADSKTIFTYADNIGQRSLFAVDAESGKITTLVRYGSISAVAAAGERVIYGLHNLHSPVELFALDLDSKEAAPVTRINTEKVAAARMGEAEQFTFKGFNDHTVYGYVVKPVDFDPSKRYAVAFLIHGGPQGSFGNQFHYRWNPQAYAGAGYAAVMVDFHGSTGYGQEFCDAIRGDWGGKPFVDLQKGLAAALEHYPWMDGERVAALGASFGGYMINWIAGNWPDRFRCLVSHDGNLDERMAYFDTEELWFPEWDHLGTPWTNPEGYRRHNPIEHVDQWRTPMLIIHGARDYRVVDTQGIAVFTALQRRGVPGKFLYFPDENHWVLTPANSILWHETVIGWLDQWTGKD